jgi:hypothetical protein
MMPLQMPRKARNMEKVENLCRSTAEQSILPTWRTHQITLALLDGCRRSFRRRQGAGQSLPEISDFGAKF